MPSNASFQPNTPVHVVVWAGTTTAPTVTAHGPWMAGDEVAEFVRLIPGAYQYECFRDRTEAQNLARSEQAAASLYFGVA